MMMETIPPGTILHAHYRVERALGSGGFGHVYLAVDLRTNQQCAIKEYLVTGSSGQAQLQHEARVLSRLHHPSLPVFVDAFSERGRYYIALSYIEGSDLTDYVRLARQHNEPIPLRRILEWILAISDAVHFLHSQQPPVIHRDIKPDNIRITPAGTAILVDLGNAKAVADGARTLFFARHQGTPGYAPPEQYPGGSGTDARSDVYALGGTLYFALTTHEPPSVSTRNQALQQSLSDLPTLQEQIAHNPPEGSVDASPARQFRLGVSKPAKPAPRHSRHLAQLGTLPPEVLERLNTIIRRAMALKPHERYQSIADMGADLKGVLDALPAQTPPPVSSPPTGGRGPDPNSTQPDLPQIYEALQTAREKADQQVQAGQAPTSSSLRCPRCNASLTRQSTFCPQCGAPLMNMPLSNPNNAPFPPVNKDKLPSPQNRAPSSAISAEKTLQAPPTQTQQPAPVFLTTSPAQDPRSNSQHRQLPSAQRSVQGAVFPNVPLQNVSAPYSQKPPSTGGPLSMPQAPARGKAGRAPGSNIRTGIIIVALVLLVLLVLLVILLLAASKGHNSAQLLHDTWLRFSSEAQLRYERNLPFGVTSTTIHPLTGLWTCS